MRRLHTTLPKFAAREAPKAGKSRILGAARLLGRTAAGAGYLALAWARGAPGVAMHARIAAQAARIMVNQATPQARALALEAVVSPMDSVRYFEFDFAWSCVAGLSGSLRFLDVSSPRLFPLTFLLNRPTVTGDLLNPDVGDLALTRTLVEASGLSPRCTLRALTVEGARFEPGVFDLVTSISVVEHIPAPGDTAAVEELWRWIRPGGKLVLTVPCAREAFEEFVDADPYGLLLPSQDGFYFGQRFYDEATLETRFFRLLGAPRRSAVFGERNPGVFFKDREQKLRGAGRPSREPWAVATGYRRFGSMNALPGIGVVGLEFVKPG